uniref:Type III pantothenate kinase n=1 Tax=Chlorobium chlorochromatii (strain CaD3) TaxID=340177 RepID=COAX_CHLCH|nr:RecName: Full=Type III pantothenate kinase; AltName: Full=PanK-III; AltName: Full=Pantothenic acid kinase [Chlorobium chlorochromatii CaD3]
MDISASTDRLLLVVEIGNSSTSFVVFQGDQSLALQKVATNLLTTVDGVAASVEPIFAAHPMLVDAVVCSVVPQAEEAVVTYLHGSITGKVMQVNSALKLPFTLAYEDVTTFGADRLALCAWCCLSHTAYAFIALDIGTACTIDVLNSKLHYLGGMIMPGLELMARSLHEHTARLPLVDVSTVSLSLLGNSTTECMQLGIVWNFTLGLEKMIESIKMYLEYEEHDREILLVATGGAAPFVTSLFTMQCQVEELAVAHGARLLFSYNQ